MERQLLHFLKRMLPWKDLGHHHYGETFLRFRLLRTSWFSVYIHWLECPYPLPECHDHPWHFWTLLLWRGYWELIDGKYEYRKPGSLLYRPAKTLHGVVAYAPSWSLVLVSRRVRNWSFRSCQ